LFYYDFDPAISQSTSLPPPTTSGPALVAHQKKTLTEPDGVAIIANESQ
jgi:hypothetical protein